MRVRVRVIDLKTGEEKNIDIEKEKTNVGISLQTCSSPPQRDRPKGFVRLFFFCSLQWGTLATKTRQTLGGTRNVAREEEAMRSFPGTYFGNDTIKHCIW